MKLNVDECSRKHKLGLGSQTQIVLFGSRKKNRQIVRVFICVWCTANRKRFIQRASRARTVKKVCNFPVPSRDVTKQTLSSHYSLPGRVWLVTSRLGTGKLLTFFYTADSAICIEFTVKRIFLKVFRIPITPTLSSNMSMMACIIFSFRWILMRRRGTRRTRGRGWTTWSSGTSSSPSSPPSSKRTRAPTVPSSTSSRRSST